MSTDASLRSIVVACPDCDLLNQIPELSPGESAACARCEASLSRNPENTIERGLALTFTAVVLFFVSNAFPFLSFGMEGVVTHTTLVSGIVSLYTEGMYFLAAAVAFTTIVTPLFLLSGLLYLLWPLQVGRRLPGSERLLGWMLRLLPWNMAEIFLIGIIVAGVKLHKMASLVPGISVWSFMALIIILTLITTTFEPRVIWERLERLR
jgi:paraquat-inducible protein A